MPLAGGATTVRLKSVIECVTSLLMEAHEVLCTVRGHLGWSQRFTMMMMMMIDKIKNEDIYIIRSEYRQHFRFSSYTGFHTQLG